MYFHFETFAQKIKNIYNLFSKNLLFFNSLFLIYFVNFNVFLGALFCCNQSILINFGCINLRKICRIPEKKYGYGRQAFSYFSSENRLNLCLNLNKSQTIYAYKRYGSNKRVYLHSSQMQTILVGDYVSLFCRYSKRKSFCS